MSPLAHLRHEGSVHSHPYVSRLCIKLPFSQSASDYILHFSLDVSVFIEVNMELHTHTHSSHDPL